MSCVDPTTHSRTLGSGRTKEPLPVELQLGGNSLRFTDDGWQVTSLDSDRVSYENTRMKEEIQRLRAENEKLQSKLQQTYEEGNMARFQSQLLLEMLSVSRVDEKEFRVRLKREEIRTAELCGELEQALAKIVHEDSGFRRGL
jgi:formylmethanofuran dehydrogenase subunit E